MGAGWKTQCWVENTLCSRQVLGGCWVENTLCSRQVLGGCWVENTVCSRQVLGGKHSVQVLGGNTLCSRQVLYQLSNQGSSVG